MASLRRDQSALPGPGLTCCVVDSTLAQLLLLGLSQRTAISTGTVSGVRQGFLVLRGASLLEISAVPRMNPKLLNTRLLAARRQAGSGWK